MLWVSDIRLIAYSRQWTVTISSLIVLIISLSIAVSVGAVAVPTATVWSVLLNKILPGVLEQTWSQGREAIVWDIRFPRALLAIMVGAGLAPCGC